MKGIDMLNVTTKITALQKFLKILSWTKVLQLLSIVTILGVAIAAFDNRQLIYHYTSSYSNYTKTPAPWFRLTKESRDIIDAAVIKSDIVVGIQITLVDFNKNTRMIVYSKIDDPGLEKIYNDFSENSVGEIPLFNSDSANNVRMSRLINGEFICDPFKDTIAYKLAPAASNIVSTVCANGIPPTYGRFTGIVSIYLKTVPSQEENDRIRTLSRDLSLGIFERDLK
jgi:hypothetical protein